MIEKEILGCFIKENTLIEETVIQTNQFKEQSHQLLFQSMKKLSMENKAIDRVTLLADNYKYMEQLGGPNFITEIEMTGNVDNFDTYERKFIEDYKQRESENYAKKWLSQKDKNANELIDDLQKLSELEIAEEIDKNDILKRLHDLPYMEQEESGILSGLSDLDNITGGFQSQSSYILGARPSAGKSATMLKFALTAMKDGIVPVIFSLEMSKESLLKRLIATIGNINLFITRKPNELTETKKTEWQRAIGELYELEFEIYDNSMQSIQYMRSQIRKVKRKYEGKRILVMIDYLTLIENEGNFYSDHARVSDISKNLKKMAKDYDCPVVTLAQLSRSVENRQDKRPMLSDLRESGSIEEDADGIMFLYRDSYYNKDNESNELEINVAKHRNGPTGTATVFYQKETGKMGDLSGY